MRRFDALEERPTYEQAIAGLGAAQTAVSRLAVERDNLARRVRALEGDRRRLLALAVVLTIAVVAFAVS